MPVAFRYIILQILQFLTILDILLNYSYTVGKVCVFYMNHSTSTNDLKMKVKNKSLLFLFLTTKSALYNGNIYNYTISWLIVSIFMINLPINPVKSIRGDSLEHKFYIFDYLFR